MTNALARRTTQAAAIRALATLETFAHGRSYLNDGAVSDLIRRGDRLTAEVEGSECPHQVSIGLHDDGIAAAGSSCPYDWGWSLES